MLYRSRFKLFANVVQIAFAFFPVIVIDSDLDKFVTIETNAYFLQYRFSQTFLADRNNRVKGMGVGAQGASLSSSDGKHGMRRKNENLRNPYSTSFGTVTQ